MANGIVETLGAQILELDEIEFWIGCGVLSLICIYSFWRMYSRYHDARLIENIPTAKIRSAIQGYVELIGQTWLMDGPVIVAPLTGTTCVWYRYQIEEEISRMHSKWKSQKGWSTVKSDVSEELFILEDDTGRCVIDPDHAYVIPTAKKVWYNRKITPARRYTEERIHQNETLYTMGLFKTVTDVERKREREDISNLLKDWKQDPGQLLHLYDSNRDGILSIEEWEQARIAAKRSVKLAQAQQEKQEQLNILACSLQKDRPFILSTIPESKLIKHYKGRAVLALISFLVTGGLSVWAINLRVGL